MKSTKRISEVQEKKLEETSEKRLEIKKSETSGLSYKQKLFAELVLSDKYKGNATQAYIEAYTDFKGAPTYGTARCEATKLLAKPSIQLYQEQILLEKGFTKANMKNEITKVAFQDKNLAAKNTALKLACDVLGLVDRQAQINVGFDFRGLLSEKTAQDKLGQAIDTSSDT